MNEALTSVYLKLLLGYNFWHPEVNTIQTSRSRLDLLLLAVRSPELCKKRLDLLIDLRFQ